MLESIIIISLTIASVVAAFISAIMAYKSYGYSKKPEVIPFLKVSKDKKCVYLAIKNIGRGLAYNVTLDIGSLPVEKEFQEHVMDFCCFGITTLAPGEERKNIVKCIDNYDPEKAKYTVKVKYFKEPSKKPILKDFQLDYYSLKTILYRTISHTTITETINSDSFSYKNEKNSEIIDE